MRIDPRLPKNLGLVLLGGLILPLAACDNTANGTDGGEGNPDGGSVVQCPGPLPAAAITCTTTECTATEGTKSFGEATLDSATAKSWVVVTWATSEVAGPNDNTTVDYAKSAGGALSPAAKAAEARTAAATRALAEARARELYGDAAYAIVFRPELQDRVRAEAAIRAMQSKAPIDLSNARGTAIQATRVRKQAAACSASAPSCGAGALCVIAEGDTDGQCASALSLKFRTGNTTFDTVSATVRKVGTYGAIVVDDADTAAISDDDVNTLLTRFDEHIAPVDHQFFGEPKDQSGKDRDQNGVVILFLTSKVATRGGASLVGYFQSDDLAPSAQQPTSNAADILYMQPPSATISMEAISGTIGHEYQHLINYYQKKILRGSGPEDVWLDEGIATFAEDILGYGGDAFDNAAAYLGMIDQTSLTGAGFLNEQDSNQRRGMAYLLVRYLFEQAGGASISGASSITDQGGVAAVKKLVQSADTGTLLFTEATTGRSFNAWVGDLLTTVAVSNAGYDGVSCNPKYSFRAPVTDEYTGKQRGLALRGAYVNAKGQTVQLNGPVTATLEAETGIPLPTNGGEVRTVDVSSGTVKIGVAGSVDFEVGFRPLPTAK